MMPICPFKHCRNTATVKSGTIIDTDKWEETVYVCPKHYKKLLKILGRQTGDPL